MVPGEAALPPTTEPWWAKLVLEIWWTAKFIFWMALTILVAPFVLKLLLGIGIALFLLATGSH